MKIMLINCEYDIIPESQCLMIHEKGLKGSSFTSKWTGQNENEQNTGTPSVFNVTVKKFFEEWFCDIIL